MSGYYYLGEAVGVLFGLALVFVLVKFMHKDLGMKAKYDERQNAIRGIAYKYSFFTVMIGNAVYMIFAELINRFFKPEAFVSVIVALGILVYAGYSIFHEAYLGLNETPGRVIISFIIIALINLAGGITQYAKGNVLGDEKVGIMSVNLTCGVLMLLIVFMILIKKCMDKREVD